MNIIRWIGLRKCREKLNVPIIVATPKMESVEAQRPTIVRTRSCSFDSDMVDVVGT